MKVASTRGARLSRALIVTTMTFAIMAGFGIAPIRSASAYISGPEAESVARTLEATGEPQKAADIRQPSGINEVEVSVQSTRNPTRIQRAAAPATRTQARGTSGDSSGSTSNGTAVSASTDGWQRAKVSWYGPGFIGNTMAGGGTLEWGSMVVAHRSMAFGTRIEFAYNGNTCVAVVMDRGPYAGGRVFDLGPGTAAALGFSGVGTVDYRILN